MSIVTSTDLEQVGKFIDGLAELSAETGVTIYAEHGNAQLRVGGENVGLRLDDSDWLDSGYQIEVRGDE